MPADGDIDVIEGAVAHHEPLGGAAFLGRAAVIAHAALQPVRRQPVLHRRGRQQGGGAQHVMAAAMPAAAGLQRPVLGQPGFLRQARQRVVFAQDGDHRPFLARLTHDGGRDAGDVLRHAEAFLLQHLPVLGGGTMLGIVQLRHAPDAVAEGEVVFPSGFDLVPDLLGIALARLCHGPAPPDPRRWF
jgi:hypothetical protein